MEHQFFAPDLSTTGLATKMWTNSQRAFYVYSISMVLAEQTLAT